MRHLQSKFVVAALSCGQQQAYNAFVSKFQPELATHGAKLVSYYKRAPGGADLLNKAVTELANAASKMRAEDPQGFCTATWNLFWVLDREPQRLTVAAVDNLMYGVPLPPQCQSPPAVSADRGEARPGSTPSPGRAVPVK